MLWSCQKSCLDEKTSLIGCLLFDRELEAFPWNGEIQERTVQLVAVTKITWQDLMYVSSVASRNASSMPV